MEAIAFQIVSAVQKGDFHAVAEAMVQGANPNCRYAGTYPLHMAVETKNVDMAAYLVHWGAKPEGILDSGNRTALYIAKKIAGKNAKNDSMVKILTDEEELKRVVADLQRRLEEEHQQNRAKRRAALPYQALFFFVLALMSIVALHAFIILAPAAAEKYLPPKMLSDIQLLSPLLEHPAHKAYREAHEALMAEQLASEPISSTSKTEL